MAKDEKTWKILQDMSYITDTTIKKKIKVQQKENIFTRAFATEVSLEAPRKSVENIKEVKPTIAMNVDLNKTQQPLSLHNQKSLMRMQRKKMGILSRNLKYQEVLKKNNLRMTQDRISDFRKTIEEIVEMNKS